MAASDRLVAKLALLRAQAHSQEAGQALADHGGAQELGGAEGSSNEGCLRDEQREMMIPATENALNHLPSLKQSGTARGKAYGLSNGVRRLSSHACKPVCAKKDACGGKGTLGKLIDTNSGEEPFELVGATSRTSLEEVKMKIAVILKVYMETRDTKEAFRCIRELGVSFFHHDSRRGEDGFDYWRGELHSRATCVESAEGSSFRKPDKLYSDGEGILQLKGKPRRSRS
ncbi:hypothetical protein DY000_02044601 [Brassica cretica]|uniref:MI domain-containing protein n=1 Tax=Brassica cretica TaxID=69181 RepID=A0ABQ7F7D9_BRACR|nr:hypothetical protein DY000_02044601 [Brassica cretica]